MKGTLWTIIFLLFYIIQSLGQTTSFDSVKIIPANPTSIDTILFIGYIETANSAVKYDHTQTINDTTITIYSCYLNSADFWVRHYKDTTVLGRLNSGYYHIQYTVKQPTYDQVDSPQACRELSFGETMQLDFEVLGATNIAGPHPFSFEIYPSPVADKLKVHFDLSENNYHLQILSVDGETLISKLILPTHEFLIDVSQLPPGMYFIMLQDEKHRYVKKFVKQ